ncbi:hypothetical protein VOLCADRAFT_91739 [Volvox carteri f. nagariensis]|uniref:Uncharacterized protein n=1 Tax=Volvox carteri f. nagariensis TaxID=3068 RepID=D8TXU6_VOLCA|nr:uncharacterized protein VOLCADRAFT_91739 [Volvox carteri f. nagariensis]EFJ47704.1 hypothetical protein VOLCADRAFT_91739 [Volvox carteri f. nagariensis]|eukprot:XP_002951175.1 hypothetical protein VOLCADRAFT_91739 [Volvox carteri f. nagariensis]
MSVSTSYGVTPRDCSPEVVTVKDVSTLPSAREQLAMIRTEVQVNNAPKLTAPHEQREQLDEGTLMLLETAITALGASKPQLAVAGECLKITHHHLKCYSVTLAKAGPGANGNFMAPYEIWHGRQCNFTKPEFKPEAIDKGDGQGRSAGSLWRGRDRQGGVRDSFGCAHQNDRSCYDRVAVVAAAMTATTGAATVTEAALATRLSTADQDFCWPHGLWCCPDPPSPSSCLKLSGPSVQFAVVVAGAHKSNECYSVVMENALAQSLTRLDLLSSTSGFFPDLSPLEDVVTKSDLDPHLPNKTTHNWRPRTPPSVLHPALQSPPCLGPRSPAKTRNHIQAQEPHRGVKQRAQKDHPPGRTGVRITNLHRTTGILCRPP